MARDHEGEVRQLQEQIAELKRREAERSTAAADAGSNHPRVPAVEQFFVEDEPAAEVWAAFDGGEKCVTGPRRFRTGMHVPTTIYEQLGGEPSKQDPLLGYGADPQRTQLLVGLLNRAGRCRCGRADGPAVP